MKPKKEIAFNKAVRALKNQRQVKQKEADIVSNLGLLEGPQEYLNLVQKANPETVDELYMLLEDIHTVKKYLSVR